MPVAEILSLLNIATTIVNTLPESLRDKVKDLLLDGAVKSVLKYLTGKKTISERAAAEAALANLSEDLLLDNNEALDLDAIVDQIETYANEGASVEKISRLRTKVKLHAAHRTAKARTATTAKRRTMKKAGQKRTKNAGGGRNVKKDGNRRIKESAGKHLKNK